MSEEVFYVSELCGPPFPRWLVVSTLRRYWNRFEDTWSDDESKATVYADRDAAAADCAILQRRDLRKAELTWARVPIHVEVLSDRPVDYEALKSWIMSKLQMSLDISTDTGPTPDALVFVSVDFGKFEII